MARSTKNTDSGTYVNGVYTTKNGTTHTGGLGCPKGTRLYDSSMTPAIFFEPDDVGETEEFVMLTPNVAPDILPYYAISNYGRVMNIYTGKIMKPNYRPNGYEYLCLAADNCKNGQKKYNTHRLVAGTFIPTEHMETQTVDHVNGKKSDNYVNKTMPDGSIKSNLEWVSSGENNQRRSDKLRENGRAPTSTNLTAEDIKTIRELYSHGFSMSYIHKNYYKDVSSLTAIQNICTNKSFIDPSYKPRTGQDFYSTTNAVHILSDIDAEKIRDLYAHGFTPKYIRDAFYPTYSMSTIHDIVNGVSHTREVK